MCPSDVGGRGTAPSRRYLSSLVVHAPTLRPPAVAFAMSQKKRLKIQGYTPTRDPVIRTSPLSSPSHPVGVVVEIQSMNMRSGGGHVPSNMGRRRRDAQDTRLVTGEC
eukprot:scaffold106216_cov29-Tisochrysis_lutea.AAC.2